MGMKANPKDVKARIKAGKEALKVTKAAVNEGMKKLIAGEEVDAGALRASLALFIKSAKAVTKDNELLKTL